MNKSVNISLSASGDLIKLIEKNPSGYQCIQALKNHVSHNVCVVNKHLTTILQLSNLRKFVTHDLFINIVSSNSAAKDINIENIHHAVIVIFSSIGHEIYSFLCFHVFTNISMQSTSE
jgi:hypothetical protein